MKAVWKKISTLLSFYILISQMALYMNPYFISIPFILQQTGSMRSSILEILQILHPL